ncbi:DnaB-like helicase N-terminal domain-containing protein, partial [Sphingomonas panaciterrae]
MTAPIQADQGPPRNVETEAALLGALMIDNRGVDRVADLLTQD